MYHTPFLIIFVAEKLTNAELEKKPHRRMDMPIRCNGWHERYRTFPSIICS